MGSTAQAVLRRADQRIGRTGQEPVAHKSQRCTGQRRQPAGLLSGYDQRAGCWGGYHLPLDNLPLYDFTLAGRHQFR